MIENIQLPVISASIISFIVSFLICFIFVKINTNFRTNKSNQKRLNSLNIVPLGGVGMAASFFISVRLLGQAESEFVYISIFALAIAIIGVIDDFLNLNWKVKIIFQFVFVLVPIYYLNLFINFENIFGIDLNNNLNLIFTSFWIILLMNSINFTDNMDGFASLNTAFICLALSFLSFIYNQNYLADISFILMFSILGFFILNFPPAKIYMGDSGSLFIGFVLGFISILFDWNPDGSQILYSSFAPVFLFFTIPVLDFFTVFVYRIKNNISPTTGGTDHISHRLLATGIDIKNVLIIFIMINLTIFSLIASSIIFNNFSDLIIIFYFIFVILMFFKFSRMDVIK
jgi:UDP-GlcNAc:undecaprenyl-phosphate GlcNAc-1-phosphate transferase